MVQKVKNGQYDVVAVAEPTCLVLHSVMPSPTPVDGHLGFPLSQALGCSQTPSGYPADVVVDTLKQGTVITCMTSEEIYSKQS